MVSPVRPGGGVFDGFKVGEHDGASEVVAERLGHADPAMTLRVYPHVVPGMQRDAAARAAEIVFGP